MSNILISFVATISVAVWIYTKQMRRSGNNTKNSAILSTVVGFIVFFIILSILSIVDSALSK